MSGPNDKWQAVVRSVAEMTQRGRPVLVGTRTVAASEHLSRLLESAGLEHQVLNARQDQDEAAVISRAAEPGRITVATNMAGRGTDIRLDPDVVARGGLHVIATERHDSGRIDRQLFGRCGRQGIREPIRRLSPWTINCSSTMVGRSGGGSGDARLSQHAHSPVARELLLSASSAACGAAAGSDAASGHENG